MTSSSSVEAGSAAHESPDAVPTPPRDGFADEYPFPSRYLTVDGVRYHYIDEGAGDPLLFVHGNPTWSFIWRNLVKGLRDGYRTVAVDHIGCGFSAKPTRYRYTLAQHAANLAEFVGKLDLRRITLVAHDWGGPIGLLAASRMPDRFARLVLFNTAAFPSRWMPWRIAACRWPIVGLLAVRGFNAMVRGALRTAVCRPECITPAVRTGYLAPYDSWAHRVAIHRFVKDIPMSPQHPSWPALLDVEASLDQWRDRPVLLIWGERDWCFTPAFLDEFRRRWPHAECRRLPDAGHFVFEDAPQEVSERLRGFLEAHPLDDSRKHSR